MDKQVRKRAGLAVPLTWLRPDVLVATVGVNVLALALPIVVLQVYDRILPNHAVHTLGFLVAALIVAALLDGFLRIARSVLLAWRGVKFEHRQTTDALRRVLESDLSAFESRSHGVYLDRIQALEQVREFYHGQAMLIVVDLPFVLLYLGLIWLFAGDMVLIPITVIGAFLILSIITAHFLRQALRARSDMDERKQNFLIEALGGVHTLKAMAMESQMMRRFERLQGQSANAVYLLARVNSVAQALGVTFSQVVMVSFLSVGAIFVLQGQITIGALAAGTMLAGRVLQPTLKAMSLWTQLQAVRFAQQKFEELLALPSDQAPSADREPIALRGEIELAEVSFTYPNASAPLLSGVSLRALPGEAIGITGNNGVGKSTLLNLIMGFVPPDSGRVLLDRRDLADLDFTSVRSQIALVPQTGTLFNGTILENLTLFREGGAVDDAIGLSRKLGLDETIARLPEGLDTQVGGGMVNTTSEGFRQRVIMVRSLLGNPRIILFDDANSGFDARNDGRLERLLAEHRGRQTMIIVSHRPSILRLCDRVYELSGGRLGPVTGWLGPLLAKPDPVAAGSGSEAASA